MLDFLVHKRSCTAQERGSRRATKPDMLKYGNTDISGTFGVRDEHEISLGGVREKIGWTFWPLPLSQSQSRKH
jgi:hypothetical protein